MLPVVPTLDPSLAPTLPASSEVGVHGLTHLPRFWARVLASNHPAVALPHEPDLDAALLHLLRLPLQPTLGHLLSVRPTLAEFERWVDRTSERMPEPDAIARFNDVVLGGDCPVPYVPSEEDVLTEDDWRTWHQQGYVVVPNALSQEACDQTVARMCAHLGVDEHDPATWYDAHPDKQGIMVQLFRGAQLEQNRLTPRVRRVFEQLWQRTDLLPSFDRVGMNPPVTDAYAFPGPELHWDASLATPIPFGTQGLIYLRDTDAEQGALTLVPGMHRTLDAWLASLPDPCVARTLDLHALGSRPVGAAAGSLVVWHQALAHGSRPNRASRPRFVQYVNYQPVRMTVHATWV